jgi:hypothetical protein
MDKPWAVYPNYPYRCREEADVFCYFLAPVP